MLTLTYQLEIMASPKRVWHVLTHSEYYSLWAKAFSPNSQFSGNWGEGEQICFFDPELGGTKAIVDRLERNHHLEYHHISIFGVDQIQEIDSDSARKWIGSRETYQIEQTDHSTLLVVTIETHPDFVAMFNDGWEKALPQIKMICEQQE
ncbi:2-keto-3-deoxygluconate kinase [Vibrio galatheae]|uniref:2-keto-3-deoxygluconate kinase n=1 Tax=Vibrio galatheae TaxID=579748 RepID=A0A0F4NP57_9VIBR|nr:SRPBCC domain-containing protein [Vibrio galatheae]KJY83886.1 2-keto-3-deoxygluconate kinase [Vibrio galatheae]